jgi:hypothetical protein
MLRAMIPEAGLVFEAWKDFDRVVDGVGVTDGVLNPDGQSSIAWTLGHVTEHVDRWFNFALQSRDRHPLLGDDRFRMGSDGRAEEWDEIVAAVRDVRDAARPYLENLERADLDDVHELPSAAARMLGVPLTLRYALFRTAAHHYFHIGVIACQRDLRGEKVGDYPGLMSDCL